MSLQGQTDPAMREILAVSVVAVIAAALLVPQGLTSYFADRAETPALAPVAAPRPAPPLSGTLRVPGRGDGHYQVEARIGARRVPFLIDTGATVVALTWETGRDLGLVSAGDTMDVSMSTANGTVKGKTVVIPRLEIDTLRVDEVRGVVMPQGALGTNLLGMSFLSRLKQVSVAQSTLILEQ